MIKLILGSLRSNPAANTDNAAMKSTAPVLSESMKKPLKTLLKTL